MSANFLGVMNEISPFRFWCQKVLPLVYDDSLSYYELLCKVVDYINKLIEDEQELVTAYTELEEYVNNYFDNLDVQNEINNKLDAMAADGSLTALIKNYIDPLIEAQNVYNTETRNTVTSRLDSQDAEINAIRDAVGSPLKAATISEMTDTNKIYVYTGSETGYTAGNWYYYNGSAWVSGGVYNAVALNTDTTLTVSGIAADAKVTGEKIGALNNRVENVVNLLPELDSVTTNGLTLTSLGDGKYRLTGTSNADTNFTFFSNNNDIPNYMERGKEYYAILQNVMSSGCRLLVTTRPDFTPLTAARNRLEKFEIPESNGILIALNVDTNRTFNDVIEPIIVEKNYFTDLYLRSRKIDQITNFLTEIDTTTINGVTLTNVGNGQYTLTGTATQDTNFEIFRNAENIPTWAVRGKKYYIALTGNISKNCRLLVAAMPGFSIIAETNNLAKEFIMPISDKTGFFIAINVDGNKTYNETFTPAIIEQSYLSDMYLNNNRITDVVNLLPEKESESKNGLTLTNIGNGMYTLIGTASADTNFEIFRNANAIPEWMHNGEEYYMKLDGISKLGCRLLAARMPGFGIIGTTGETRNCVSKFTAPESGGLLIAINVDIGTVLNEIITPVMLKKNYFTNIYLPKQKVIVSKDDTGDFSTIKAAIEYANNYRNTTIRIMPGTYNLVEEFGDAYLDSLSNNNPDYGLRLGNGVHIICSPRASIYFDYDGTNEWVVRYFSPFNVGKEPGYIVEGMRITAHNCRYIMHDDPVAADKMAFSHHVWKDCYFEIFPSPQVASWPNHQIIGGGFGYNTLIDIDSCIFNAHYSGVDHYSSLSYHNDVSGAKDALSRLTVKNCYFSAGNRIILEGYGASTRMSEAVICGNSFGNALTDIVYDSTNANNITVYQFNNQSR